MTTSIKKTTATTILTFLFLFAFLSSTVTAADGKRGLERSVQACVAEIRERADFSGATRALHWVVRIERKNRVERSLDIETTIFASDDDESQRRYHTSCVTGALHRLVEFRIEPEEEA